MARKTLQLGKQSRLPPSPDRAVLDRVPNPHPDTDYVARFTVPDNVVIASPKEGIQPASALPIP